MTDDTVHSKIPKPLKKLRTGFTTGACATAAAKAALLLWHHGKSAQQVEITLPKNGQTVCFAVHQSKKITGGAEASIIKDAGDDPDVTHGAEIIAQVMVKPYQPPAQTLEPKVSFFAGVGVGTVTQPGLPLPVGDPAINPVPRQMIAAHLRAVAADFDIKADFEVTLAIANGLALAEKTWNPRLGIVGGLSVLGTSGIVKPYSCAAWIHSIHRGIDVARALGLRHVAASTGNLSETAIMRHYPLSPHGLIDMGDFAAPMLKYLRRHPIAKVTICGGFGKMLKLAAGHGDLHSKRSQIDFPLLAQWGAAIGIDEQMRENIKTANSAHHLLDMLAPQTPARRAFLHEVARRAEEFCRQICDDGSEIDILFINRQGEIIYPC